MLEKTKVAKLKELAPYADSFDVMFREIYEQFLSHGLVDRDKLPSFGGVYAFYNKSGTPVYVGRADNIKKRIAGHTRPSSSHNSANFAFNIARLEFIEKLKEAKLARKQLLEMEDFVDSFTKAKIELHGFKIRCVEIKNDIIQTMFEPYLAWKLKTYPDNNTFENH